MADQHTPDFAERLRRARRAAGLSQEALAARAGLSARAISALERGVNRSPRRDTLDMLADALALSGDERRQWDRLRRQAARRSAVSTRTASRRAQPSDQAPHVALPVQLTRFFGREDDVQHITQMLRDRDTRLVTLTGPGGTGKTRLAIEVGRALLDAFPDGVIFVDLAPVSDPELVLSVLASTLGLRLEPHHPLFDTITAWLAGKRLLVLLDNLEQVLEVGPSIARLCESTPTLRVLATSRAPLRVRAEHEYPVAPLPLPPLDADSAADQVTHNAAVQLFFDRAAAARPAVGFDDHDALAVARICQRLDGLPLAIELAAASIRLLPPQAMFARLGRRLPLLERGPRDAPARQRTLRSTIAWSYDLLSPDLQRAFRALSALSGEWTLETAAAVSAPAPAALAHVAALVEYSLVQQRAQPDGAVRFTMLETIREFALDQLDALGEADDVRRRVAGYVTELVAAGQPATHWQEVTDGWLQQCVAEHDTIRAVLEWALAANPALALRLAGSLYWFWWTRGYLREGRRWLERALLSAAGGPSVDRPQALAALGDLRCFQDEYAGADACYRESLALYEQLGDAVGVARAQFGLARSAHFRGDFATATALYEACMARSASVGDDAGVRAVRFNLSGVLRQSGDPVRARALMEAQLAYLRQSEPSVLRVTTVLASLGWLALLQHDWSAAAVYFDDGLRLCLADGNPQQEIEMVEGKAALASVGGLCERAVRLWGAAHAQRAVIGYPTRRSVAAENGLFIALAEQRLSTEEFARAWSLGQRLSLPAALAEALTIAAPAPAGMT